MEISHKNVLRVYRSGTRLETYVRNVRSRERGTLFGVALDGGKGGKEKGFTLTGMRRLGGRNHVRERSWNDTQEAQRIHELEPFT